MVTKVIGRANDFELIFIMTNEGLWETTVPYNLDGEYVVEVRAFDEAGNEAYMAKMLFIVNRLTMEAKLIPLEYIGEDEERRYMGVLEGIGFSAIVIETDKEIRAMVMETDKRLATIVIETVKGIAEVV